MNSHAYSLIPGTRQVCNNGMRPLVPTLANGLPLAFSALSYDRGALYGYTVTIGHAVTFTRAELYAHAPDTSDECDAIAREFAELEERAERAELASLRDWLNAERNGRPATPLFSYPRA